MTRTVVAAVCLAMAAPAGPANAAGTIELGPPFASGFEFTYTTHCGPYLLCTGVRPPHESEAESEVDAESGRAVFSGRATGTDEVSVCHPDWVLTGRPYCPVLDMLYWSVVAGGEFATSFHLDSRASAIHLTMIVQGTAEVAAVGFGGGISAYIDFEPTPFDGRVFLLCSVQRAGRCTFAGTTELSLTVRSQDGIPPGDVAVRAQLNGLVSGPAMAEFSGDLTITSLTVTTEP